MTNDAGIIQTRSFVRSVLPWLLGACMLAVYLVTLQRTATPYNLERLADVRGWNWTSSPVAPVAWLVTLPVRWLPSTIAPLGLNFISAICAALTLALLARSVSLLPHDRTNEQREREPHEFSLLSIRAAWLPPLLAVLVCGLQMSFWERAIEFRQSSVADAGETLNLLLFAYIVRCLLEYRIGEQQSWLSRCAIAYGLAIANNWAMIAYVPPFLVALVWIKGFEFFNWRFLLRMFLWFLAGLSLIFLTPAVEALGQPSWFSAFMDGIRRIIATDRYFAFHLYFPKEWLLLFSFNSFIPIFLIGIRWASSFGDNSPLGIFLAKTGFNLIHGFFLLLCLYVALDPQFGPRQMYPMMSFLPLYYLGALSIGYFAGYFLLVFGRRPAKSRQRPAPAIRWLSRIPVACVWLLAVAAPVALIYKNFAQIETNKSVLRLFDGFFLRIGKALPPEGAVVLSDDPFLLLYLRAVLDETGKSPRHLYIHTGSLIRNRSYTEFLDAKNPDYKLTSAVMGSSTNGMVDIDCIHLLETLAASRKIYYVHSSFGYYFERFYAQPRGVAYQLNLYPTNTWIAPPLTAAELADNEAFWKDAAGDLKRLSDALQGPKMAENPTLWQQFTDKALLSAENNRLAAVIGRHYAKALDYWGVELSRSGRYPEAGKAFALATNLSSDNVSASINVDFNKELQAGTKPVFKPVKAFEPKLGNHRNWLQVLNDCGPFDEASFCVVLGSALRDGLNYRQSALLFNRAQELLPDNPVPSLLLCQLYRAFPSRPNDAWYSYPPVPEVFSNAVAMADRAARISTNNEFLVPALCLKSLSLIQYGGASGDGSVNSTNLSAECYSNAVVAADRVLGIATNLPDALFLKAVALIQLGEHERAIPSLDILISAQTAQTNYSAYLDRAICHLRLGHLDAAKSDYDVVARVYPKAYQVYFGLGDIAYQQKDKPLALHNYELYMSTVPGTLTNSEEAKTVLKRLDELKQDPP